MRAYLFSSTLLACLVLSASSPLRAQEPARPSAPPSTASPESTSKQNPGQSAGWHSNDFLVRGTVFTEEGLTLPGAELRIRRSSEKKFRWETETNSRGNFAVRV